MSGEGSAGLTDSIVINAGIDKIKKVLLDFESYPKWMSGVEAIEVLSRDSKKRGKNVRFVVDAVLRKISYVLEYSYKDKENRIDIGFVEGDLDDCNSYYLFEPLDEDRTEVSYHYDVKYTLPAALRGPLTKRLLKQLDKRVMKSALNDLKARAESL